MRRKLEIESGTKFNRWTVVKEVERRAYMRYYMCRCECGTEKSIRIYDLFNGNSQSCGCYHKEEVSVRNIKHNDAGTVEWMTWNNMKSRCYCDKRKDYIHYGGRGIKVCDRWLESYSNFLEDMGRRPGPEYSIDRIDVNGNYEPSNCKWVTKSEQVRNRRPRIIKNKILKDA